MNKHFKRGLLSPLLVLDSRTIKRIISSDQEEYLSDTEALHSDWQKVGDSLRSAMEQAKSDLHND